jgi:DNA-binding MarR family transcriptional regulator
MAKSFDLATSPSHLLRRANQYANDLYSNEQEAKGLTQRQLAVLYAVDQQEGVSQTQLVRATGIDRSTLADMIVRMQGKELLARKRTDEDARANSVRITPTGRRALKAAMPAMMRAETRVLDILPQRTRTEFIRALGMIAQQATDEELAEESNGKGRGRKKR